MTINSALADKISYSKYVVMHDWWILLSAMQENTTVLYIDLPLLHIGSILESLGL